MKQTTLKIELRANLSEVEDQPYLPPSLEEGSLSSNEQRVVQMNKPCRVCGCVCPNQLYCINCGSLREASP